MENKYNLKITMAAYDDLDSIYLYVSENLFASSSAENLMDKIESEINKLKEFPFMCEFSRDETLRIKGYRRLVINNYVVLYLVDEDAKTVIVARVFYGAMDYGKYI